MTKPKSFVTIPAHDPGIIEIRFGWVQDNLTKRIFRNINQKLQNDKLA
jgi:hypothetical protein